MAYDGQPKYSARALLLQIDRLKRELEDAREVIDTLEEANLQLAEQFYGKNWMPPLEFGLTPSQARILCGLVARSNCSREYLHECIGPHWQQTGPKIVDVQICRMRKKLAPFGITIGNQWGQGYFIDTATRDRLKKWDAPASEAARPSEITETNPTGAESAMQEASTCQM